MILKWLRIGPDSAVVFRTHFPVANCSLIVTATFRPVGKGVLILLHYVDLHTAEQESRAVSSFSQQTFFVYVMAWI